MWVKHWAVGVVFSVVTSVACSDADEDAVVQADAGSNEDNSGGASSQGGRGSGASGRNGQGGAAGRRDMGSGGRSRGSGGRQNGGSSGGASQGAGGTPATPGEVATYGQVYEDGQFHEGPVDYEETEWHNACAPGTKYAPAVRQAEGSLLAGLWGGIPNVAGYCDACIFVTTEMGKSALLRVVTYGDTSTNSIDVSPEAYAILNSGEFPRAMSWQFAKCADTGEVMYEFQTESSEWWTSLWVRNARVPLTKVEVQSENHRSFVALQRGSDGTLTDGGGFGAGPFTFRLTGMDGQVHTDTFEWPSGGVGGETLRGQGNFE